MAGRPEEVLWERALHQRVSRGTVAVAGDHVVVHERASRLVCLDRSDGSLRWDVPFGLWPRAVVAAGDHCLGIPQNADVVICWDLRTGAVLWTAELPRYTGHMVVGDGTVLVGGWRGYTPLQAFDLSTGRLLWSTGEPHDTVPPLVVGDHVLLGRGRGTSVRLVGLRDGRERGRWELPEPLASTDVGMVLSRFRTEAGDRVLVRCGRRSVVEVEVEVGGRVGGGSMRTLRRHDRDLTADAVHRVGGLLWLREAMGYAVADDAGTLRWRVDLRQRPAGGVVAAGSDFLVGGEQGTLFRIDPTGRMTGRAAVSRRIAGLWPVGPTGDPDALIVATRGTLLALGIRAAAEGSSGTAAVGAPGPRLVTS
ncbi:PQQ-binding-like beta-propeller repeat protein [Streptomyces sp. NPDC057137]|uniref:outer membrane protein assembly factor BamB family protein n=1 Tax=Streptomyces sp. NPDC057137 TaxID=3346030 RepID=UPI003631B70E